MKNLIIFGASGHGKVVADAADASGWNVVGWADDDAVKRDQTVAGRPVVAIGAVEAARYAREHAYSIVVAIGDNRARHSVCRELDEAGASLATVIHPSAVCASGVSLGEGTVLMAGAVVNPDTSIGRHAIVNTSASVDHDNHIGDFVHISPGARLGGTVSVGEGTHVGIGATLRNGVSIGSWAVVGAGAVVLRDIESNVVAYGVPARAVRSDPDASP